MGAEGLHPRVAVIAIIPDNEGRVVAGQRISPLGSGKWSFPGGHLDQGEDFAACAERETMEETGLRIRALEVVAVTNDVFVDAGKHYISIFMRCERTDAQQQPQRLEPNKCEGWYWKSWEDIRALAGNNKNTGDLFLPVANLVQNYP
ncbi:hypothetical protein EJ04DRAFT_534775 [Polyplosphaeria fusca]|uniref:Nudix hydrolase domain-containing protein n=1 Tax=Polyplosphaeria fusca TaxID=682080 RepID=A0A9P4R0S1_9PLEO|nr:hypothetical protein EJ04DRAFT_534775 [Polyplosphaeria fusca]